MCRLYPKDICVSPWLHTKISTQKCLSGACEGHVLEKTDLRRFSGFGKRV